MFEVVAVSGGFAAKRLWSTGLGLSGQALLLACAALAPLVSPPGLPRAQAMMAWLLPAVPPPPPPVGNAGKALQHLGQRGLALSQCYKRIRRRRQLNHRRDFRRRQHRILSSVLLH